MTGLTLDTGALIGVERRSARVAAVLAAARRRRLQVRIPAPVLAQVFRGGGRQARLSQLLGYSETIVVSFDGAAARATGELLGLTGTTDVVDAAVVVCAWRFGDRVVTSDPHDLRALDARLEIIPL